MKKLIISEFNMKWIAWSKRATKFMLSTMILFVTLLMISCSTKAPTNKLDFQEYSSIYDQVWHESVDEFGDFIAASPNFLLFSDNHTVFALNHQGSLLWTYETTINMLYDIPSVEIGEQYTVIVNKNADQLTVLYSETGQLKWQLNTKELSYLEEIRTLRLNNTILLVSGLDQRLHGVFIGFDLESGERYWVQFHGLKRPPLSILNCNYGSDKGKKQVCLMFGSSLVEIYRYDTVDISFVAKNSERIASNSEYEIADQHLFFFRAEEIERLNIESMQWVTLRRDCDSYGVPRQQLSSLSSEYLVYTPDCKALQILYHRDAEELLLFEFHERKILSVSLAYDEESIFVLTDTSEIVQIELSGNILGVTMLDPTIDLDPADITLIAFDYGLLLQSGGILAQFQEIH